MVYITLIFISEILNIKSCLCRFNLVADQLSGLIFPTININVGVIMVFFCYVKIANNYLYNLCFVLLTEIFKGTNFPSR